MKSQLITPFITSTMNTLGTMARILPTAGEPYPNQTHRAWGFVNGVIDLAGDHTSGTLILSFECECILEIAARILGEDVSELDSQVLDTAGELTNIIAGGVKARLAEEGHVIHLASPVVVTGENIELSALRSAPFVTIPFESESGRFVVQASIREREEHGTSKR